MKKLAGQRNRLMDIPIGNNNIFESTNGMEAGDFALSVKQCCGEYYGSAVPRFIEYLTGKYESSTTIKCMLESRLEALTRRLKPMNFTPEQARALRRFMLVQLAGEIAIESGVLPYDESEIATSVHQLIEAWLSEE